MLPRIDLTQLNVSSQLDWQAEFGLWLRRTPTQKRTERSHLSVDAYTSDIEQMSRWFTSRYDVEFSPDHINSANLQEYFGGLDCAPATHNRKLASVRMLIKWSRSVNMLDYDPSEWIPLQDATRKSPRDVNNDERMMLELAAEENESTLIGLRDSLIFFLMSNAGLRINEVVTLKLSDVDLDDKSLHVFGKGAKHRTVDIGGRLLAKIKTWMARMPQNIEGTLVTDERGLSIGRGQAWRRFTAIAERAEVKVTPHAMRHTFVIRRMQKYMAGDPFEMPAAIDDVCQQTGDRPEVILAYYTRAKRSKMKAVAEMM